MVDKLQGRESFGQTFHHLTTLIHSLAPVNHVYFEFELAHNCFEQLRINVYIELHVVKSVLPF